MFARSLCFVEFFTLSYEDSLERHSPFHVTSQIHHFFRYGRYQGVSGVLLGIVIARNGQRDICRFGRFGDAKDWAGEEHSVWFG